jgi:hypothetical protein
MQVRTLNISSIHLASTRCGPGLKSYGKPYKISRARIVALLTRLEQLPVPRATFLGNPTR